MTDINVTGSPGTPGVNGLQIASLIALLGAAAFVGAGPGVGATPPTTQCAAGYQAAATAVAFWSTEARCAIVPAGPNGVYGTENFGNKFPGDAAVYVGIVHVAIYQAAAAAAPAETSLNAAIATAAYDTLTGLQLTLTGPPLPVGVNQMILDNDYKAYLAAVPDGTAKTNGISVGQKVAQTVLALRANDGRDCSTTLTNLNQPAAGPGIWEPNPTVLGQPTPPVLGLCLPGMRPLAHSGSQFQPGPPNNLRSSKYADDFNQIKDLGSINSTKRTSEQTTQARFWTDHDTRQWNDGLLRLAAAQGLDLVQTAHMLAMAHVAGADALIACFAAKYHYWFWRPYQAIPQAYADNNPRTLAVPNWQPLGQPPLGTPNHPEYPSAHACHSAAVVTALEEFFGTDEIPFTLDSRITNTTSNYARLGDVVTDVIAARVLIGFHFLSSDLEGAKLGQKVGRADRE
jgi:PAP2 superfamily